MHVHSPIFHGQLTGKKIRPITLIVWVLGCLKKGKKIKNKIIFVLNKYQNVTHASTFIFQVLFQKYSF